MKEGMYLDAMDQLQKKFNENEDVFSSMNLLVECFGEDQLLLREVPVLFKHINTSVIITIQSSS